MSLLNLIVAIRKGFSEWRLSEQAYGNLLAPCEFGKSVLR